MTADETKELFKVLVELEREEQRKFGRRMEQRYIPEPKYDYGDTVSFMSNNRIVSGEVYIIDRYGTFEQNEEPSYDIMVGEGDNRILYKHIRQSWLITE